jgi:hypothetical protein
MLSWARVSKDGRIRWERMGCYRHLRDATCGVRGFIKARTKHGLPVSRPRNPRPGTSIPARGRIGKRGLPVSPPFPDSCESGIGEFPLHKKNGNPPGEFRVGNPISLVSDEHQLQWTRNIPSREYHGIALTGSMRLLCRVGDSEREHAAVSNGHQLQWTQHILSGVSCGSDRQHAAPSTNSGSERGSMLLSLG